MSTVDVMWISTVVQIGSEGTSFHSLNFSTVLILLGHKQPMPFNAYMFELSKIKYSEEYKFKKQHNINTLSV